MRIDEIIWLQQFVEKLAIKHDVEKTEVEEVLANHPYFRFVSKGDRPGEDVYSAMGQTDAGRYLIVVLILKSNHRALIVSARDMDKTERRNYGRQK
ncbi:BrnT family toxin [Candidatus Poribacteria bacterium]|nr:BrnT family toxin [Candidatus Poribacteria bacterium]MXY27685.1 BrnT family toxin [Candidatus Poribacteria bacterium]